MQKFDQDLEKCCLCWKYSLITHIFFVHIIIWNGKFCSQNLINQRTPLLKKKKKTIIQRELKYLHYLTLLVPHLPHLAQNCPQIPWQGSGKDQGSLTMDVMSSDPSRRNQTNDENASNFDCYNHTKRHSRSIKYTFYQTRHHPK